jgi:hypothetical protein
MGAMPEPMLESFFTIENGKDGDVERALVWRRDQRHHDVRDASVVRVQSAGAMFGHWPQRRLHSSLQVELFGAAALLIWKAVWRLQLIELNDQCFEVRL